MEVRNLPMITAFQSQYQETLELDTVVPKARPVGSELALIQNAGHFEQKGYPAKFTMFWVDLTSSAVSAFCPPITTKPVLDQTVVCKYLVGFCECWTGASGIALYNRRCRA